MFEISYNERGDVELRGRLDASQAARAQGFLDTLAGPCVLDLTTLDYISSAGMGVLLGVQKRLSANGQGLILTQMNRHIRELFTIAGFNHVFTIK